jgi:hypothetical protein
LFLGWNICSAGRVAFVSEEDGMAKKAKKAAGKKAKKRARKSMDRKLVAGRQGYEVDYESRTTGRSRKSVKKAVKRVGSSRKKVRKALRR